MFDFLTNNKETSTSVIIDINDRIYVTMRWFKKHLNWTWVFAWILINLLGWLLASITVSAEPNISQVLIGGIRILVIIYSSLLMFIVSAWVVNEKGHSLWWILLQGIWAPVWLSNNRTIVEEQIKRLGT